MDVWRQENTDGYTDAELASINAEWEEIVAAENLETETDEYREQLDRFGTEVAGRAFDTEVAGRAFDTEVAGRAFDTDS